MRLLRVSKIREEEGAMRKILIAAVAVLGVGGLVFAGFGAQAKTVSFPSNVTIHKVAHHPHDEVAGKVLAGGRACRQHRAVTVLKRVPGPDTVVGAANTGSDRRWGPVSVAGSTPGRFYAHVGQVTVSGGYYQGTVTCRADNSHAVFVK